MFFFVSFVATWSFSILLQTYEEMLDYDSSGTVGTDEFCDGVIKAEWIHVYPISDEKDLIERIFYYSKWNLP